MNYHNYSDLNDIQKIELLEKVENLTNQYRSESESDYYDFAVEYHTVFIDWQL